MKVRMAFLAMVAAIGVAATAHAQELQFIVDWGTNDPGVVETFDVDASVPGTPSAASTTFFRTYQDIDFIITNDNLGNSIFEAGDSDDYNYFSTGKSDFDAFYASKTFSNEGTVQFYNGSSPYLQVSLGELAIGGDGTLILITAVSAAPEPSAWALMILGTAMAGGLLQCSRRRQAAGVPV